MHVSILGDSISTYTGMNPRGYAVYFDEYGSAANGLRDVSDTWWSQVLDAIGGDILVNDSFSGSLVSGTRFPAACCAHRTGNLSWDGVDPDLILIYLGINDYGYCAPVKPAGPSMSDETIFFLPAYKAMLHALHVNYPEATIVCGTLMRAMVPSYDWTFPEFNQAGTSLGAYDDAIREAAAEEGALVIDFARCGVRYETLEGLHPTVRGHAQFAEQWLRGLRALGIAPEAE